MAKNSKRLILNIPPEALDLVEPIADWGDGEAGWMIYLNEDYSFDPMGRDTSRFIPLDNPSEALDLIVFPAAKSASAA